MTIVFILGFLGKMLIDVLSSKSPLYAMFVKDISHCLGYLLPSWLKLNVYLFIPSLYALRRPLPLITSKYALAQSRSVRTRKTN